MIISHKHKFIFIKTKKTAGTSMEIALSGICGPDDVITPITPKDELIRKALGFRGPQNITCPTNKCFYNHISAVEIREMIGRDIWDQYYKFCFERNPWDKVLSWYYWKLQRTQEMTLDEFIQSGIFSEVGGPGGFNLYTANGNVIVDKVCLYERLGTELTELTDRFGLEKLPALPTAKSEFRKDRRPYREILSEFQRDAVAEAFRREIRLFNYEY